MRFSLGLWDALFGEKIILQASDEKGNIVTCKVSKKWLEQAQLSGNSSILTQNPAENENYSAVNDLSFDSDLASI